MFLNYQAICVLKIESIELHTGRMKEMGRKKDDFLVWTAKNIMGAFPEMRDIIREVEGSNEFCFEHVEFEMQ